MMSRRTNEPVRAAPKKTLLSRGADVLMVMAVVGAVLVVPGLSRSNSDLRSALDASEAQVSQLDRVLGHNLALSRLEGQPLPADLLDALEWEYNPGTEARVLLVAYTYSVCVTCLDAGLRSLSALDWSGRSVELHALVGERTGTTADREYALLLREDGLLDFPVSFVAAKQLYAALYAHLGGELAAEPVYLILDAEGTVTSAFQAHQQDPSLLDAWLGEVAQ